MEKEHHAPHKPVHQKPVHHKPIPGAHEHKTKYIVKKEGLGFLDKIFLILIVASIVYFAYLYFQQDIIRILQMNPYVWAVFSHIAGEISKSTLTGLFYASFFGSLFFIFFPLELLFIYYLTLGYSLPLVISITLIGYVMGLCLDYLFGFVVGARIVRFFIRGKFEKFHNMITKWGSFVVFFGNVIIFPIQPVSVVIGSARYPFKKFFLLSILGLFAKLFVLVILSTYFGDYIASLVQGVG